MKESNGITHIIDWVGEKNYPNVADFIEEARDMGVSRRIRKDFDFSQLSQWSCLAFVHRRGYILNADAYGDSHHACPKSKLSPHDIGMISSEGKVRKAKPFEAVPQAEGGMCAGLFWEDIDNPEGLVQRQITVENGDTRYNALLRPRGVAPIYAPAIFLTVPITRIVVVNDPEAPGPIQDLRARIASQTWLDVTLMEN